MSAAVERRPVIGLGDLLRAAVTLDASPDECIQIAKLLDVLPVARPGSPQVARPHPSKQLLTKLAKTPVGNGVGEAERAQTQALEQHFDATSAGDFELVGPTASTRIDVRAHRNFEPIETVSSRAAKAPHHETLFAKLSARNILAASLSIFEELGPIDAARLIDDVASCRGIKRIPREFSATLRRGAVVLVDRSDALEPFSRDVVEVLAAIAAVVGRDRLTRFSFDGTPTQFSRWDDGEPWRFSLPAGTPVLLISDLGLRQPSAECAWDAFTKRVARAGCLLIALVPYPSARLPERLARRLRVVTWDRNTTVAVARRAAQRVGT